MGTICLDGKLVYKWMIFQLAMCDYQRVVLQRQKELGVSKVWELIEQYRTYLHIPALYLPEEVHLKSQD